MTWWKGLALLIAAFVPPVWIICIGEFILNDIYFAYKDLCGDKFDTAIDACRGISDNIFKVRQVVVASAIVTMLAIAKVGKIILDPD